MSVSRLAAKWLWPLLAILIILPNSYAGNTQIRMAYFEGGKYPYHDRLKEEFHRQLEAILPDSLLAVFAPEGYRSAEWDRDKSKQMAGELIGVNTIDLVVAQGPWVVNDLLEAGFTKPIVGIHQFAPQFEGLLDKSGKPKAENLTFHYQKNKIESDLTALAKIVEPKRVGLIYYSSSNEADSVLAKAKAVGKKIGFEVVTATGENNKGTFAIFNAYGKLDKRIDALYVGPMWACDIQMINQFFYNTDHDRIPVMVSEDKFFVERGALLTNNASGLYSEARFSAFKAAQIIMGKKPNTLPVEFTSEPTIAINEKAATKERIQIEPRLYSEAYVVPSPPDEDVTVMTLSYAIARAMSFNPGDTAKRLAIESAIREGEKAVKENFLKSAPESGNNSSELISVVKENLETWSLDEGDSKKIQLGLENAVTRVFLNYVEWQEILQNEYRIRELIDRNVEVCTARFKTEKSDAKDLRFWKTERSESINRAAGARNDLMAARIILNTLMNFPIDNELSVEGSRYSIESTQKLYAKLYQFVKNDSTKSLSTQRFYQSAEKRKEQAAKSFEEFIDVFNNLAVNGQKVLFDGISLSDKINQYDAGISDYDELNGEIRNFYESQLKEISGRNDFYESMLELCALMNWSAYDHAYSFVVRIDKLITEGK